VAAVPLRRQVPKEGIWRNLRLSRAELVARRFADKVHRRPRTPWLRRIVDAQVAARGPGVIHHQDVAREAGVIRYAAHPAHPVRAILEHRPLSLDIFGPLRPSVAKSGEELEGVASGDALC